ncbi:MAG: hypothetical protein AAF231_10315 [Pseudomonadota bacterium]
MRIIALSSIAALLLGNIGHSQSVSFVVPSDSGVSVMMDDGNLLFLNNDCTVTREGGGTGYWWNGASFFAVGIDGSIFRLDRELEGLPFCAPPEPDVLEKLQSQVISSTPSATNSCQAEGVLALINYWQNRTTQKFIDEMCLDRTQGTLSGSETLTGFQLVRQQPPSERYEILVESNDADLRTSLDIAPSISTWSFYEEDDPQALEINVTTSGSKESASVAVPSRFFSVRGYLSDNRYLGTPSINEQPLYIWGEVFRSNNNDIDVVSSKIPPLVFTGSLSFRGKTAQAFAQGDSTYHPEMGTGKASLNLQASEHGSMEGSITLSAENSRFAGFSEGEWRSLKCQLDNLKGHILRNDGKLVRAIALGKCAVKGADWSAGTVSISLFLESWPENE